MSALANAAAARRLDTFKRLLVHIRDLLSLDFGFVLWDGATVPADLQSSALAIVLADEGVVAAMLRRPNADTLLNLWVAARIDIRNGAIFDFLAHQPNLRTKDIRGYLGDELANAVDGDGIHVDGTKMAEIIPTLPLGDARIFDQLCSDVGIRRFAKEAGAREGLTTADLRALAATHRP